MNMKSLYESLLDDFDTLEKAVDPKIEIRKFIKDNYIIDGQGYEISQTPNKDGYYVVDAPGKVWLSNFQTTKLTNDLFIWGKVNEFNCSKTNITSLEGAPTKVTNFSCYECKNLKSLKGAPKEVKEFLCYNCPSLTSLEGAPTKVGRFSCSGCSSLTSLKGAPKEARSFVCTNCTSLQTLKGCPRKVERFNCQNCIKLKSLQYAPKEVGKDFFNSTFICSGCGTEFTEDDVLKVTPNIKRSNIYV